jgi:hypothetical protein
MEQACQAEGFDILSGSHCQIAHHHFHRVGMNAQLFGGRPFLQELPGVIAGKHGGSDYGM